MKSSKVTHHPGYDGTAFSTVEDELETHTTDIAALETAATGYVVGPASATDLAAARFDLTTGKLIQDSVLVIADTTGSLSRTGNGGIPVQGTNTNDAAAAGYVGELQVATGSAVALTTSTPANVCSITITAGDWDVSGLVQFSAGGATVVLDLTISHSTTSATHDTAIGKHMFHRSNAGTGVNDYSIAFGLMPYRYSVTSDTTIYLVATGVFTTAALAANGRLAARRMR
jgi:hypothetical protein